MMMKNKFKSFFKILFILLIGSLGIQIIISCSLGNNDETEYDTFNDSIDGKKYKTVVIGTQTWTAENLNYGVLGKMLVKPTITM